jgi:hypothetical protein
VAIGETGLYPFAIGRILVYSEYTLDTLGVKVGATAHRRVTYVQDTVAHIGKAAFKLIDSVYRTNGTLDSIVTTYAAVENGDLLLEYNGAWSAVFKRSAGTNTSYFVRTYNDMSLGFAIPVTVNAKILAKEDVPTPGGSFQAYKLEMDGVITAGLSTITIPVYSWFADNYGLIKQTSPPMTNPITGGKTTGTEMIFVSKNF